MTKNIGIDLDRANYWVGLLGESRPPSPPDSQREKITKFRGKAIGYVIDQIGPQKHPSKLKCG